MLLGARNPAGPLAPTLPARAASAVAGGLGCFGRPDRLDRPHQTGWFDWYCQYLQRLQLLCSLSGISGSPAPHWELLALGGWAPFTSPAKPLPLEVRLARLAGGAAVPRPPGCPPSVWGAVVAPCFTMPSRSRPTAAEVAAAVVAALNAGGPELDEPVVAPQAPPAF